MTSLRTSAWEAKENINLPFLRSLNGILLLDIKQSLNFFLILLCEAAQHSQNLPILGLAPSPSRAKADISRFLEK